jgi:hypothetical protein
VKSLCAQNRSPLKGIISQQNISDIKHDIQNIAKGQKQTPNAILNVFGILHTESRK